MEHVAAVDQRALCLRATTYAFRGFPGGTSGKESAWKCRRQKIHGFIPWVAKTPWRRAWQPTPVFLPGENPMDREAWQGIVYKIVKSWTWLKWLNIHALKHSALVKSVSQAGTWKIWFCEFGLVRKVVLLSGSAVCALYVVTCWVNIILLPHYNYTEKVGYIPHLFMSELLWCSCD